jgi:aspartyl-tRNA(Asn)/glutamyl-tRNA(Gln) amidotransferase subunit C
MPPAFTVADVERIAALARLELSDDEKTLFTRQIIDILAYAGQVQAVDTSGIAPMAHVHAAESSERAASRMPSPTRPTGPPRPDSFASPA